MSQKHDMHHHTRHVKKEDFRHMDPTDTPIVQRCMAASPNINDYFVERRYIAELEQEEYRTPQMLTRIAVNLLMDELSEMGIETNMTCDEILESSMDLNVLFNLRDLFDKDKLYDALKAFTPEVYSEFESLIENISLPEDFLYEITDFFGAKTPNDERWVTLQAVLDRWASTEAFSKHIVSIMDKVNLHSDPNKSAVDDTNLDTVQAYLTYMTVTADKIRRIVDLMAERVNTVDWSIVGRYLKSYDRETLDPDVLPAFAEYHSLTRGGQTIPEAIKTHWNTTWHHPEYWKRNDQVPTKEQIVVIAAGSLANGVPFEKLAPVFVRCDGLGKILLAELYKFDYSSIIGDNA